MATFERNPFQYGDLLTFVSAVNDTYQFINTAQADLSGKSVLITGASKGIGKHTAFSFASAGCSKIVLAARSDLEEVKRATEEAASKAGRAKPQVVTLQLDVTSEESVAAAAREFAEHVSDSLDILINNAGYLEDWLPIAESSTKSWWHSWEINLKGVYLCTHYFLPLVLKSEAKVIINVTSAGAHNISPGASAYQTSKLAICRFTEFIDMEYHKQGVVSISVHPGGVATELGLNMPIEYHVYLKDQPELPGDSFVWLVKERREWLAGRFVSFQWNLEELEKKKEEIVEKDLLKFRMVI